jgi:hypothetical protein
MKRPSDDDGEEGSSSESKAGEFAHRVLARSRKLILIAGIALGILIVIAVIVSKFSGAAH